MSVEKEGSNHIVDRTDFPFGFTILRRGVWARETEEGTILSEMFQKLGVVKFTAIITLKCFNIFLELSLN